MTGTRSNSATVTAPGWRPWYASEIILLRNLKAENATKERLIAIFPNRTWEAIKDKRRTVGPQTQVGRRQIKEYPKASPVVRVLTARRRALGMSRKDLALRLGVYFSTLERWEHGRMSTDLNMLAHWAAALGMEITARPAAL